MTLKRFKSILYDTYQMDLQLPPLIFRNMHDFEETSYVNWTVQELIAYFELKIGDDEERPTSFYICEVDLFLKKINRFARVKYKNTRMFIAAHNLLIDLLDLLESME